jgi:hypothetical protein
MTFRGIARAFASSTFLLVALAACGRKADAVASSDASAAPSVSAAACAHPVAIQARIHGAFTGSDDATADGLFIGTSTGTRATMVWTAPPFFAAEASLDDLCSDDSPSSGAAGGANEIAVRCVGPGGRIRRTVVRSEGTSLSVRDDGAAPRKELPSPDGTCFDLHGLGKKKDLEPLRAAWGNDTKSARCAAAKTAPSDVHVTIEFPKLDGEEQPHCAESGTLATNSSRVVVSIAALGMKRDLGRLDNQCGAVTVTRFDDANALTFEASDMGTSRRAFYQLGDSLYVTGGDGRLSATPLPCGAKAVFDLRYPFKVETRHERMRSE